MEGASPGTTTLEASTIVGLYTQLKNMQRSHRGRGSPLQVNVTDDVVYTCGGSLFLAAVHLFLDAKQVAIEPVDTPEVQYGITFSVQVSFHAREEM